MNDLLNALGIQWPLLLSQAINFLILLFILQRFVYKPVLSIVDKRRDALKESARKMDEVNRLHEQADRERSALLSKADTEAGELLEKAKQQAEHVRVEIETAAHAHAEQIAAKTMKQLQAEREHVLAEVQEKLAEIIVHSTEKILRREFSPADQDALMAEIRKNLPTSLA